MSLTVDDVEIRVYSIIRDSQKTYVTETQILAWCNDAQRDLGARQGLFETAATGTMGGAGTSVANGTIDFPTGLHDVMSLRLGEDDDAEPVDTADFYGWEDSDDTPAHTLFHLFDGKIYLYPRPTTGTAYALRYKKQPTTLTAGTDALTVPVEMHRRVADYATAMALYAVKEDGRADRFMAQYERGLRPLPTGRQRHIPTNMSIKVAPGPFDDDYY